MEECGLCVCIRSTNLFKFVGFVEIRDLSTGEYVVDVLEKSLFDNLCVGEQKDSGLVLNACLVVQLSDVCNDTQ